MEQKNILTKVKEQMTKMQDNFDIVKNYVNNSEPSDLDEDYLKRLYCELSNMTNSLAVL